MWLIKCILLICSIAYVFSKNDLCQVCGLVKPSPRIFNGVPANYGPWVVYFESFNNRGINFCSGTIIDFQHILTSSHCFLTMMDLSPEDKANSISIFAGDLDKMGKETVLLEAEAVYLHPNFSYFTGDVNSYDDIAIIKLIDPIEVSQKIKPACIFGGEEGKPDTHATIQGFGFKSHSNNSNKLLEANLKIQSDEKCKRIYNRMYTSKHLCAKNERDTTKGACPGDSGGSLLLMVKGKQHLVGISSWGGHCDGFPNEAVVFTRVRSYLTWIRNVTNNHADCTMPVHRKNN